jgi:hypothetical protein
MQLSVKGSGTRRKIVKDVMTWAAYRLMSERLLENIEIVVYFRQGMIKKTGFAGLCGCYGPDYRGRDFEIEIACGMSLTETLETALHEMVHVKQYAKGELYDSNRYPDKVHWKGRLKKFSNKPGQPWEVEAYAGGKRLLKRWIKENQIGEYAQIVSKLSKTF